MELDTRRSFLATAGGATAVIMRGCPPPATSLQTGNVMRLKLDVIAGQTCLRRTPANGLKLVKKVQEAFVLIHEASTATSVANITCTLSSPHDLNDIFEVRPATNPFTLAHGERALFVFKEHIGGTTPLTPRKDKFKDSEPQYARKVQIMYDPGLCAGVNPDDDDILVEC